MTYAINSSIIRVHPLVQPETRRDRHFYICYFASIISSKITTRSTDPDYQTKASKGCSPSTDRPRIKWAFQYQFQYIYNNLYLQLLISNTGMNSKSASLMASAKAGMGSGNCSPELSSAGRGWDSWTWTSICRGASPPALRRSQIFLQLNCGAAQGTVLESHGLLLHLGITGFINSSGGRAAQRGLAFTTELLQDLVHLSVSLLVLCSLGNNTYLLLWGL